jgi:hypothetical protein
MTLALLLALGCSEYTVREEEPPPVAEPPTNTDDDEGDAPDWADCDRGWLANYYNLADTHPAVEPAEPTLPVDDPSSLDWWDDADFRFERYEPSLDLGLGWWPVDEGLTGDPAYFSARFNAWLFAEDAGEVEVVLGATTDAWVLIDGAPVASVQSSLEFAPQTLRFPLQSGQFPIELRFAHRTGTSGLRFRVLSESVTVCYPDFEDAG